LRRVIQPFRANFGVANIGAESVELSESLRKASACLTIVLLSCSPDATGFASPARALLKGWISKSSVTHIRRWRPRLPDQEAIIVRFALGPAIIVDVDDFRSPLVESLPGIDVDQLVRRQGAAFEPAFICSMADRGAAR